MIMYKYITVIDKKVIKQALINSNVLIKKNPHAQSTNRSQTKQARNVTRVLADGR